MQKDDALKSLISAELKEGEVILWASRPTGIRLLDVPYRTSIIIRWVISLAIFASGIWYALGFTPTAENLSVNSNAVITVWFALAVAVALWPVKDAYKLKRKCCYFITDKRALLFLSGVSDSIKVKSFADVDEISFDLFAESRGNIYIGKKLKNSLKKARVSALTPPLGKEDDELPLVFHSVKDPERIMKLMPS